jgi:hypothetical protein
VVVHRDARYIGIATRNGVQTTRAKGVATAESSHREHASAQDPMTLNCADGVIRATRVESTMLPEERTQKILIAPDQRYRNRARQIDDRHLPSRTHSSALAKERERQQRDYLPLPLPRVARPHPDVGAWFFHCEMIREVRA